MTSNLGGCPPPPPARPAPGTQPPGPSPRLSATSLVLPLARKQRRSRSYGPSSRYYAAFISLIGQYQGPTLHGGASRVSWLPAAAAPARPPTRLLNYGAQPMGLILALQHRHCPRTKAKQFTDSPRARRVRGGPRKRPFSHSPFGIRQYVTRVQCYRLNFRPMISSVMQ